MARAWIISLISFSVHGEAVVLAQQQVTLPARRNRRTSLFPDTPCALQREKIDSMPLLLPNQWSMMTVSILAVISVLRTVGL